MESFKGKLAVITGAGTGMGRELALALAAEGAHLGLCDVAEETLAETRHAAEALGTGVQVSTFLCDVADEQQMLAFRDHVAAAHETDALHLLFNNAGIGGGGTITDPASRPAWDKTFAVCWGGVLNGVRAFMDMLKAADKAHIINTASINGFWASVGPHTPHTAYSAAKFAVKGFTEALITDLRLNAPHIQCSVVMPGHIGTQIVANSMKVLQQDPAGLGEEAIAAVRAQMVEAGLPVANLPDDDIRGLLRARAMEFEASAPTTAQAAAEIILQGVREQRWRILVGEDAHAIDQLVRENPENAYEPAVIEQMYALGHFKGLVRSVESS
jgi:NAD(P)-dependent dehydrogenase (short-subunit alcohol dehydrogenase family)